MCRCKGTRWLHATLVIVVVLWFHGAAAAQSIWRVDANTPADCLVQDGQTWPKAFKFLTDALAKADLSAGPDEILVAEGVYYPDESCAEPAGTDDRTSSFVLVPDLVLRGGFPTGGGLQNPTLFDDTILSGDLDGNDLPNFGNYGDNSRHVVKFDDDPMEAFTIRVEGFKITGGNADQGFAEDQLGGGVLISAGSGGQNEGGPRFDNVLFEDNRADGAGGAVGGWKIGVTFKDCLFQNNETHAVPFAFPNELENTGGGAISISGSLVLVGCRILNNVSLGVAGGVEVTFGIATVINCEFRNNIAGTAGGGAHLGPAELTNCLFFNNTALGDEEDGGGGLKLTSGGSISKIYNCTFAKNHSGSIGGGARISGTVLTRNSIFWSNTDSVAGPDWHTQLDGENCPEYCCIQDYPGGECPCNVACSTNTAFDPKFVDLALGNLRLKCDSPCVDTGNPAEGPAEGPACNVPPAAQPDLIRCDDFDVDVDSDTAEPTPDLDAKAVGNLGIRVLDGQIDMGAYELISAPPCPWDCQAPPVSGAVDIPDLLALLGAWGGPQTPGTTCDLDGNGVIAVPDLLALLAHWGPCPGCSGGVTSSLEEEIVNAGLYWPHSWDEYMECLDTGTPEEVDNCNCWMHHYLHGDCNGGQGCPHPDCPDDDPFGGPHIGI